MLIRQSVKGHLVLVITMITLVAGGVMSPALAAQFPATGQTTSYQAGDDGDIQAGALLSYTDNGDGTITDNNTGLVWEKKDSPDGVQNFSNLHDVDNTYSWTVALSEFIPQLNNRCNNDPTIDCTRGGDRRCGKGGTCGFAGHRDWRLPNVKELQSIVNYGTFNPAVSPAFNTALSCAANCTITTCSCTVSDLYWSSTTLASGQGNAWGISFGDGFDFVASKDSPYVSAHVRAVRGGL